MNDIRQKRIAEQLKVLLSQLLLRDVKDPRLQDVTVTRLMVDRELQVANVYVNALGDESRENEVMVALEKAGGFLRREIASGVRLRNVPQLIFHWDPSFAHAEEIHAILDALEIPPSAEGDTAETAD